MYRALLFPFVPTPPATSSVGPHMKGRGLTEEPENNLAIQRRRAGARTQPNSTKQGHGKLLDWDEAVVPRTEEGREEEEARFRWSFPLPKLFLFVPRRAVERGGHVSI